MTHRGSFSAADLAGIDDQLAATDRLLRDGYPGDDGSRQPVHTVYVPADRFTPALAARWGEQARDAVIGDGGFDHLGALLGQDAALSARVAPRVEAKLAAEPIEDLRLDFEDGYGDRGDEVEDADASRAAQAVAAAVSGGTAARSSASVSSASKPPPADGACEPRSVHHRPC